MEIKFGYLCIQEILVVTKWSVPPLHVSGCEMSHLLAGSPRHTQTTQSVLNLIFEHLYCCQLTAVTIGYPLTSAT